MMSTTGSTGMKTKRTTAHTAAEHFVCEVFVVVYEGCVCVDECVSFVRIVCACV